MAVLDFKGKSFVQNHHLLVKYHQLIPCKDKSLTDKVSLHDDLERLARKEGDGETAPAETPQTRVWFC